MKWRYEHGLTDYGHRRKMLTHHSYQAVPGTKKIYRLVVGKKSRYFYAGLYVTRQATSPDVCLYYSDTRRYAHLNLEQRYQAIARDFAHKIQGLAPDPRLMICLDKSRRTKLDVSRFCRPLHRHLAQARTGRKVRGA